MTDAMPPELHELEAMIMDEVWNRGESLVREVQEGLNSRVEPERAYTTILTVMQRLHAKGLLDRRQHGRQHVYVASLSRDDYKTARAEAQVEALISQYGNVALAHFSRRLSLLDPKERKQIKRLARRA